VWVCFLILHFAFYIMHLFEGGAATPVFFICCF
jgi:hypothetical protein